MKNYYRLMLGRKSVHAEVCFTNGPNRNIAAFSRNSFRFLFGTGII
jgi:hypothetical protein